jgi:hypothetical protein
MEALSSYRILGLNYGADTEEIKTAYRSLLKKYHPDLSMDPSTGDKLQKIVKAYKDLAVKDTKKIISMPVRETKTEERYANIKLDEVLNLGRKISLGKNKKEKLEAIHRLGNSAHKSSYIYLKKAIFDKDDEVVRAAVEAVGRLGIMQCADDFSQLFTNAKPELKKTLLKAIENIGTCQVFDKTIKEALNDKDFSVKSRAFNLYLKYKNNAYKKDV